MSGALLQVSGLSVRHGQLQALSDVSVEVAAGEKVAIIGANGAGKSTLLGAILGLHPPVSGRVLFDGVDITNLPPHRRVELGIALVPEGRRLFPSLSVEENLLVAAGRRAGAGAWTASRVYEVFSWMGERRRQTTENLSGGEQQAVAIGRALMSNPRVLLLDEVSLGLFPAVVRRIYGILPQLSESGMGILLVEQDVGQALAVADRVHCLLEGRTTLVGRPADLTPQQVENAYFGLRPKRGES